jgi:hypothetical protein
MALDASASVGSTVVAGAIHKAAQATGTSFDYLLATAKVESDLDPGVTTRSSTAGGLFQFLDQTWLETLKQAGPAFGYRNYADAISRNASGRYVVGDPKLRDEIMRLRRDPTANALMGGVFTQQNLAVLSSQLGRRPSESELYIAHFLGPYSAAKAIATAKTNPGANAVGMFPAAARANQSVFFDRVGRARSIAEACTELARRYQAARAETGSLVIPGTPAMAAVRSAAPVSMRPDVPAAATAISVTAFADTAGATPVGRETAPPPSAPSDPASGIFHFLFQTGERHEAVAPAVSALWRPPSADGSVAPAASMTLDLFRDSNPKQRGASAK